MRASSPPAFRRISPAASLPELGARFVAFVPRDRARRILSDKCRHHQSETATVAPHHDALVIAALSACIALAATLLCAWSAAAGERMLCQVQAGELGEWHYRTGIPGRDGRCYYQGERMKSRRELYWAEVPASPRDPPAVRWSPGDFDFRWQGETE